MQDIDICKWSTVTSLAHKSPWVSIKPDITFYGLIYKLRLGPK